MLSKICNLFFAYFSSSLGLDKFSKNKNREKKKIEDTKHNINYCTHDHLYFCVIKYSFRHSDDRCLLSHSV